MKLINEEHNSHVFFSWDAEIINKDKVIETTTNEDTDELNLFTAQRRTDFTGVHSSS